MSDKSIGSDPAICHGKPTIAGTRIMVMNILSLHLGGYGEEKIIEYYPELSAEDIKAALAVMSKLIPESGEEDE